MAASVASFRQKANKANAQKSTGPRTPEGKETSRMNNYRHGMCCVEAVPEADRAEYEERCALWVEQQNPQTDADMHVLRRAVRAAMILDRCEQREASVIDANRHALFDKQAIAFNDQFQAAIARLHESPEVLRDILDSPRAWRFLACIWLGLAEKFLSETPVDEHEFNVASALLELWPKLHESWEHLRQDVEAGAPTEEAAVFCRNLGDAMRREANELAQEIDPAGHQASLLAAMFRPSDELDRIRKYEASAERTFHRNYNALKQARREREHAAQLASKSEPSSPCDESRACNEKPPVETASKSKPISPCDEDAVFDEKPPAETASKSKPSSPSDEERTCDEKSPVETASKSKPISSCDEDDSGNEQVRVKGRASPAAA